MFDVDPSSNTDAQILHFIPGRLRIRLERLRDDEAFGRHLEQALTSVDGIHEVSANPVTGNVLIRYDRKNDALLPNLIRQGKAMGFVPDGLDADEVEALVRRYAAVSVNPSLAENIKSVFGAADGAVARATGGSSNLRSLIPVSLFVLGVRSLFSGSLQAIPWYNYFWFAFSAFVVLNPGQKGSEGKSYREGGQV